MDSHLSSVGYGPPLCQRRGYVVKHQVCDVSFATAEAQIAETGREREIKLFAPTRLKLTLFGSAE